MKFLDEVVLVLC